MTVLDLLEDVLKRQDYYYSPYRSSDLDGLSLLQLFAKLKFEYDSYKSYVSEPDHDHVEANEYWWVDVIPVATEILANFDKITKDVFAGLDAIVTNERIASEVSQWLEDL